jgi:predicted XRE-type DNA-binding protein
MSGKIKITKGSGNVFVDLGDPDAETKHLKALIGAKIIDMLDRERITARAAAKRAGCDAADIQRVRNADLARFSLDRLIRFALRLGCKIEVKVSLPKAA